MRIDPVVKKKDSMPTYLILTRLAALVLAFASVFVFFFKIVFF